MNRLPQHMIDYFHSSLLMEYPTVDVDKAEVKQTLEALVNPQEKQSTSEADRLPAGELLTVKETARRLKVTPKTVYVLLREGRLPRRKIGNRSTRVPAAAVVALAAGHDATSSDCRGA